MYIDIIKLRAFCPVEHSLKYVSSSGAKTCSCGTPKSNNLIEQNKDLLSTYSSIIKSRIT